MSMTTHHNPAESNQKPQPLPPIFAGFPPELSGLDNWVVWRYLSPKSGGKKWRKVPFQPNGKTAITTDRSTWSSFDACRDAYIQGGFEGLGFVFDGEIGPDGLCYCGIDFDGCIEDKKIHSLARERLKRLKSYWELSVSGTGLHCIARAKPLDRMVKYDGVEIYSDKRFFTFTGRALFSNITSAEKEVQALVDEIRTKQASEQKPRPDEAPPGETTGRFWYEDLSPAGQDELVEHALAVITQSTRLLELEANGGNNAEYFKLVTAVARSGAPHAEDIFVKYASQAKDADTDDALRQYFSRCGASQPSGDRSITLGTLLYIAQQHGADFSRWRVGPSHKTTATETVHFVPGKEKECREALDKAVASDDKTFVLGEAGPLAILRLPERELLGDGIRWDADLPGTTLAVTADIMERAENICWMRKNAMGFLRRARPPRDFVSDYIPQMRGRYRARTLRGVARVPRIDDDGNISCAQGYDVTTGLYHDRVPNLDVPDVPNLEQIATAHELLLAPFSGYRFEDQSKGNAQVLAMILTGIQRPWLRSAPLLCIRSSMAGTGKGKLARSIVRLAYDTEPVFATWGGTAEEFEKRLVSLMLASAAVICIDNVNGSLIQGALLESIITEGRADVRPLGLSQIVSVRNRSLLMLTGNNPTITGDMARRTLASDIVPRSKDPERDRYSFDPVEATQKLRIPLLNAAYTIMRAFRQAGMPSHGLPAIGSFNEWSRKVRDPVYWLTKYDLAEAFSQNKAEDPRRQNDAALAGALYDLYGNNSFKSSDVFAIFSKVNASKRATSGGTAFDPQEIALHDALEQVLGSKRVDAKSFGIWARRLDGAHNGGFLLETRHNPATNTNEITVRRT
jgi:hypothetical protein